MSEQSKFSRHLQMLRGHHAEPFKGALIDVADTAYGCLLWLQESGVPFNATDVLTMARMVLDECNDARKADTLRHE